uniref:ribose-5-phosphate isomerase n=2 Tax=Steinernema glaseri TaxID=37863 RepID=A0A1I7YSM3_9BILA
MSSTHVSCLRASRLLSIGGGLDCRLLPISIRSMCALTEIERAKKHAAYQCAAENVTNGARIGVGSGSTVKYFVQYLKEKFHEKTLTDIVCVPTSFQTRHWLIEAGLPVSDLEQTPSLTVCIDGADEVDANLACIKGGGGCLLQEKVVQTCAEKFFVIADISKQSTVLGEKYKTLPIEVSQFAYAPVMRWIEQKLGGKCHLRNAVKKCGPIVTDNGNYIVDWEFPKSDDPNRDWNTINDTLLRLPGVLETGLFLGVAQKVYFATAKGDVTVIP